MRGARSFSTRGSVSDIAPVLESDRRFRGVVIRQAQQNDFWPLTKSGQNLRDALGLLQIIEAPMKIDDLIVSAELVWFLGGEPDQLVAQRRKGVGLSDPDDDIKRKARHEQISSSGTAVCYLIKVILIYEKGSPSRSCGGPTRTRRPR